MIRYALRCGRDHRFDSWFRSARDYDTLRAAGQLECPECGDGAVEKALMAPRVAHAPEPSAPVPAGAPAAPLPSAAPDPGAADLRAAIEKLRREVEAQSDYVGRGFAAEARAMHQGDKPARAIHGEANVEEARALLRDGVPVLPLPFRDRRGTN